MAVTWNPSDKSANISLSNGNLTATRFQIDDTHDGSVRATVGKSSGKWKWEVGVDANMADAGSAGGIANASAPMTNYIGADANGWGYTGVNGQKYTNNSGAAYGDTYTNGDIIMVALDMDNGKVWFGKNGVWQASGDPAAGTNAAFTGLTGTIYPAIGTYDLNTAMTARFTAASQTYSAPSGFLAIDQPEDTFPLAYQQHQNIDTLLRM